ncbi:hypothetical protein NECID01_0830 [Nematocida sp. AWRm77]|nr:hypothetical protein NECID01_0830 [Nematocida sp. AWRm77]
MKVFEGRAKTQRVLVGIENKYMQVRSPLFSFGLADVRSFLVSFSPSPVLAMTVPSGVVELEGLSKHELEEVREVLSTQRVLSKEDIKDITKKDLQLQQVYQHITEEEAELFYTTFGDRLIGSLKDSEINPLEVLSGRKKAKFVFSNQTLIKVFFQMALPFDAFVKDLFSGLIFANQAENAVDKAVMEELKRTSSPLERLNAYSFLLQSTWDIHPLKRTSLPEHAVQEVLNPNLIRNLSQIEHAEETPESHAFSLDIPETLAAPVITPGTVEDIKRVPIPLSILRRLRETSRLVAKHSTSTELIKKTTQRLEQFFKEEVRRRFSPEQGEIALSSVHRILPSRFLKD